LPGANCWPACGLAFAAGALAAAGQFGGVTPPPLPNPRYPLPPTWEAELKEIAPGVYAYIQAGGPGRDNASVANAGIASATTRQRAGNRHADRAVAREGVHLNLCIIWLVNCTHISR